ncbi:hypothetical protein TVAG_446850 [Trichomonas vaginalis G3]|uniref:Peptidase M60 domain-containing protein n=1 Tax=Trichomonas vaginalis (strain ATCC PRA-98 / G3) TaxID=412133 RepID=A2E8P4_TRIV3|nr:experimental autoimmune prostatitis antigen 2-related family [Trichomonas vaginalis G3]EAY10983.1 hypothetical protein TVAG_446850 [Trichomonas vaginalis G3]KAI5530816.1 experimental autoimmune prostatitis antigen 2-related family [Trichomonas vaginalis G3]|eukprot:XP_001323206.1 hypothetical protein [Trichomonas vaginalis G3]
MGCIASSAAPSKYMAQRQQRQQMEFYDEENPPPPPPPMPLEEIIKMDVMKILQGLNQIRAPQDMSPIVCLNEYAFPLYLGSFVFDEDNNGHVDMPVVAFSHNNRTKFIYFGAIGFLQHSMIQNTETAAFLENSITWASDYKVSTIRVYLYAMPKNIVATLVSDIQSYGYNVEAGNELPKSTFDVVFCTTACPDVHGVAKLAKMGMTIFYFYVPLYQPNSRLLSFSGLAFPQCSLSSSSIFMRNSAEPVLQQYLVNNVIDEYFRVLDEQDSEVSELDNVVSKLRYYISEMTPENAEIILKLQDKSMEYLQKTGFRNGELMCNDTRQCMVCIILSELINKIPPESVKPVPDLELFPGVTDEKTCTKRINIETKAGIWHSTGLWLQAGQIATVETSNHLTIQVGAQTLCLLVKEFPWKRWPSVITTYNISPNTPTAIATQFGGPVFVLSEKNHNVSVQIEGCALYPYFYNDKPSIWEQTKTSTIPWGEIETKYVCINLPARMIHNEQKISQMCKRIDQLMQYIREFEAIQYNTFKSRLVFDVEVAKGEPIVEDVVFMSVDDVQTYLTNATDDKFIYTILLLAQSQIIDFFMSPIIERSVASCAVRYALSKVSPNAKIPDFLDAKAPYLFKPLWNVCSHHGAQPFATALRRQSAQNYVDDDEAWKSFVQVLGTSAGSDFTKILDLGAKPGMLLEQSSECLAQYQLDQASL